MNAAYYIGYWDFFWRNSHLFGGNDGSASASAGCQSPEGAKARTTPQPPGGPVLAVQPVVPGLVPCAATPGRQPAAVLFTGSCPRVLAARGQGRAPSPAQD